MNLALPRLLQLCSPALPVGAYSYSQGLEWAIESGVVSDEISAQRWIADQLECNLARFEAAFLVQLLQAHAAQDATRALQIDALYLASRESAELRAETLQMGHSMRRLAHELRELPGDLLEQLDQPEQPSFIWVWSVIAHAWQIDKDAALAAWFWSWSENQVMAALKAVPLGQAAGQRILYAIGALIPRLVQSALVLPESEMSNFAPGFAIACAQHETQYSRIFRS